MVVKLFLFCFLVVFLLVFFIYVPFCKMLLFLCGVGCFLLAFVVFLFLFCGVFGVVWCFDSFLLFFKGCPCPIFSKGVGVALLSPSPKKNLKLFGFGVVRGDFA